MIPVTDNTIKAVAALIYNHAYNQDPDSGWLANDEQSAPGWATDWLEWSTHLVHVLSEQPTASDEQVIEQARKRVDVKKVGHSWDTIWMQQTEEGDEYSTMTSETDVVMPLVRDFLENPYNYIEVSFIERDSAYIAYLEAPVEESEDAWGERKDKDARKAAEEHVINVYTTYTRNTTEQWELDAEDAAKLRYNDSPGQQNGYLIVNGVSSRMVEYKADADGEVWEVEVVPDVGVLLDPEIYRVYQGVNGDWIVEQ